MKRRNRATVPADALVALRAANRSMVVTRDQAGNEIARTHLGATSFDVDRFLAAIDEATS